MTFPNLRTAFSWVRMVLSSLRMAFLDLRARFLSPGGDTSERTHGGTVA
jgi:hypothetical protein